MLLEVSLFFQPYWSSRATRRPRQQVYTHSSGVFYVSVFLKEAGRAFPHTLLIKGNVLNAYSEFLIFHRLKYGWKYI